LPKEQVDLRWWKAEGDNIGHALVCAAEQLIERLAPRHKLFLQFARMYGNREILGLGLTSYSDAKLGERLSMNVIASCVDTATAKIAKNKPAPQFLTSGADYLFRRKAEKLNKFGKGVLHQAHVYDMAPAVFRDAAIFGTGFIKVYNDGTRVRAERVFPWEILVDDAEAMYGQPRQLVQQKWVDRAVLLEKFGKDEKTIEAIRKANTDDNDTRYRDVIGRDRLADQVCVYEGWRLPSSKKSKDGRHVIAVEGCALHDAPWKRESFPFAKYTLEDPVAGFWGTGMAERLIGIQLEINRLLQKIQRAFQLLGVPRVIMSSAAGVPKTHINNEIGAIITVNGGLEQAPTVVAPQTIHPEVFAHLDRLHARAFDEVGLNQLSVSGQKPAGLNSGIALREITDIESDRFVIAGRRFETLHIDVVRRGLDEVRTMRGFTVDVPGRVEKLEIQWKDVSLDDSAYILQCFPASLLPQTPAGRFERVQELYGAGFIDQDTAMELLDVPDLEEASSSRLASIRAIRARVASMLDGGEFVAPEAFDNLQLILAWVPRVYLIEREYGCPEDRLEMLRDYINEAQFLMAKAAAQTQATTPGAGGAASPALAAVQAAPDVSVPMAA
jgi:hypothetical protein